MEAVVAAGDFAEEEVVVAAPLIAEDPWEGLVSAGHQRSRTYVSDPWKLEPLPTTRAPPMV